jgi:DNA-binding IclR family transcriptional regulator
MQPPTLNSKRRKATVGPVRAVLDSGAHTPALDRALALLEMLSSRPEGSSSADIRASLGFSANLVFRLTKSLLAHGYIDRMPVGNQYVLSRKMLSLSQPRREERSLVQLAWETMRWLRDVSGESSHIGVRSEYECIVLDRVIGPNPFKCYVEAGARGPLHTGAPGKALLAWLPELELSRVLREMPLTRLTARSITCPVKLERHLGKVRRQGYALDLGEGIEGHHCIGAPVFDGEQRPIASIWITAPAPRIRVRDEGRLAPFVVEAGRRVSEAMRG